MPDLITHIIVGLILAKLLRVKKKSLVLLGAILPDMIYKLSLLGLFFDIPENVFIFGLLPLHSPIGLIITTILISFTVGLVSTGAINAIYFAIVLNSFEGYSSKSLVEK